MKRSRKEANVFIVVGGKPVVNQIAKVGDEMFIWDEEVNAAFEKGELDPKYNDTQLVTVITGLRYSILQEGDAVYCPAENTKAIFKSMPSKDVAVVSIDGVDKEVPRKDVYKLLSETLSPKQMSPVVTGRLRHYNKVILDFPRFEFEQVEGGINIIVDEEVKEFVPLTGDEAADNQAKALACHKYAEPGKNEDGSLRMARYIRAKKN